MGIRLRLGSDSLGLGLGLRLDLGLSARARARARARVRVRDGVRVRVSLRLEIELMAGEWKFIRVVFGRVEREREKVQGLVLGLGCGFGLVGGNRGVFQIEKCGYLSDISVLSIRRFFG
eukprot:1359689-Amorphochlora_amoeboformis.AAC.1